MTTLFDDENYVPVVETQLSEREGIDALRDGWLKLFGSYPSHEALAILAAQSSLETGRWKKINNFNFGNLKMEKGKPFTMFATGENIWNNREKKTEWHWFEPPHYQTAFRSYSNAIDGAYDYIQFLSDRNSSEEWRNEAYKVAFSYLEKGMPKEYSYALHKAGYYTANPETYTAGVIRLYDEFLAKIKEFYKEEDLKNEAFDKAKENLLKEVRESEDSLTSIVEVNLKPEPMESGVVEAQPAPVGKKPNTKKKKTVITFVVAAALGIYAWVNGFFTSLF